MASPIRALEHPEAKYLLWLLCWIFLPCLAGAGLLQPFGASLNRAQPEVNPGIAGGNILIFYVAAAVAHISVCSAVIWFAYRKGRDSFRADTFVSYSLVSLVGFLTPSAVLATISYSSMDINYFSHTRIYSVLKSVPSISGSFSCFPEDAIGFGGCFFYYFSLLSAGLVFIGFAAIVGGCQLLSIDLAAVDRLRAKQEWPADIASAIERIKGATAMLSGVLVTSTLCVALFFQIPSDYILSPESFRGTSYAMTVYWGFIFTLMLFVSAAISLSHVRAVADRLLTQSTAHNPTARREWAALSPQLSVVNGLNSLVTLLLPIFTGLASKLFAA